MGAVGMGVVAVIVGSKGVVTESVGEELRFIEGVLRFFIDGGLCSERVLCT
jgi:hypothetical protein